MKTFEETREYVEQLLRDTHQTTGWTIKIDRFVYHDENTEGIDLWIDLNIFDNQSLLIRLSYTAGFECSEYRKKKYCTTDKEAQILKRLSRKINRFIHS